MKSNQESDQEDSTSLLAALRGDLEAYNHLVMKYQDMIYNHAYALLGDRYSAEDAAQESFFKAYQNIQKFRGGSFRSWLLRIVTNLCLDQLRRSSRHPILNLYSENEEDNEMESSSWLLDPHPAVETTVERNEQQRSMMEIIKGLAMEYRSVLVLIDVHELDYSEAAQVLGIPIGTVKSRLARARLQVQKSVQEGLFASEIQPC